MRRLMLLRHAKSSWADPKQQDFDRPLNARGSAAAQTVASYFSVTKLQPDLVLCSAALRARATLAPLVQVLAQDTQILIDKRLYMASAPKLLERLHDVGDNAETVLIIGHNPGLERLARMLAGSGKDADLAALEAKFPTAALAVLEFDAAHWRNVEKGSGKLTEFLSPRDIDED